jgi:hypothetical protein
VGVRLTNYVHTCTVNSNNIINNNVSVTPLPAAVRTTTDGTKEGTADGTKEGTAAPDGPEVGSETDTILSQVLPEPVRSHRVLFVCLVTSMLGSR